MHFQKDEVALHTDVAPDAFQTNELSHREYTTLSGGELLSGSVMCTEVTDRHT